MTNGLPSLARAFVMQVLSSCQYLPPVIFAVLAQRVIRLRRFAGSALQLLHQCIHLLLGLTNRCGQPFPAFFLMLNRNVVNAGNADKLQHGSEAWFQMIQVGQIAAGMEARAAP